MEFDLLVMFSDFGVGTVAYRGSRGMRVTSGHPGCGANGRDETRVSSYI